MKLCSNEFYKFLITLPDAMSSYEELSGYIAKAVPSICDMLSIGKIELSLNKPETPYTELIRDHLTILYCYPEGYAEKPISHTYETYSNGTAEIRFFPRNQTSWVDDITDLNKDLKFLSSIIYTLCSKAYLTGFAHISTITDPVTGIANSIGINTFLSDCCRKGMESSYTAVHINLKDFRYLSRRLGPKSDNTILQKYAQHLKDFLRRDEICGRLNDDNYIAVIRQNRIDKFLSYITNVRLRINVNDVVSTFSVQAVAGIYRLEKGNNVNTILYNLSIAVSAAKSSPGESHVWFEPAMLDEIIRDKEISGSFSKAISLKEFDVYYQPKIDLKTGSLCGCEALVRWSRDGRLLSPSEFLPILERNGTICALDLYVLDEVCSSLRTWLDAGLKPVRVSTNFSKVHLHNPFLAEDIMNVINRYSIPPEYIEIELTESSGYEDFSSLSDFVKRIKGYGVYTSIDNFGTGYSSLKLINDLVIDVIKLDKSFIIDMDNKTDAEAADLKITKSNEIMIKTIINMAHELGLKVICEGIETVEQEALLKELHCDMAQGFLYDRPLPHGDFQKKLQDIV